MLVFKSRILEEEALEAALTEEGISTSEALTVLVRASIEGELEVWISGSSALQPKNMTATAIRTMPNNAFLMVFLPDAKTSKFELAKYGFKRF